MSNPKTKWAKEATVHGFCEENVRLRAEFLDAIREINALQNEQIREVIADHPDFTRFDLLLHVAHEKKDRTKYAWIAHVESHRCEEM